MARNGSGTYSVPNTFVSGQTITASSHNSNWSDIGTEITNSVAADGQTTITAGLKGANGTVSLPAYSFASDLDSGIYRIGANNIGVGVNGAKVLDIATTGLTATGTLAATSDFAINTNKFTVTASSGNTVVAGTLGVTGITTFTGVALAPDGTKTAPGYSFSGDTDTGIYRIGANNLGVSCGDTKIIDVATTGVSVTGTLTSSSNFTVSSGTVTLPAGSVQSSALAAITNIGTPAATTSGATVDFTSIPSSARIIKIMLSGVSTNGSSAMLVQIGDSGGIETSGYVSIARTSTTDTASTAGFILTTSNAAAGVYSGMVILAMENSSSNTWVCSGCINNATIGFTFLGGKSTSAALDRIRLTTVNGTDTFDAGEMNIIYY